MNSWRSRARPDERRAVGGLVSGSSVCVSALEKVPSKTGETLLLRVQPSLCLSEDIRFPRLLLFV